MPLNFDLTMPSYGHTQQKSINQWISVPCARRVTGLGGGEVRGRSSLTVSTGAAGIAAVEAGKEQLALGMQNPPQGWGKQFRAAVLSAIPGVMV
jgi:hypothetical protein